MSHGQVLELATSEFGIRLDAKPEIKRGPLITQPLTDLSRTVGIKSCPMPSTSMFVVFVLFNSLGRATIEPSGSTPMIFKGRKRTQEEFKNSQPHSSKEDITRALNRNVFLPMILIFLSTGSMEIFQDRRVLFPTGFLGRS